MSQLTNIINFDIENPQELTNDSVIMNKTHLERYNAKQGQIGNCWFLQCQFTNINLRSLSKRNRFKIYLSQTDEQNWCRCC